MMSPRTMSLAGPASLTRSASYLAKQASASPEVAVHRPNKSELQNIVRDAKLRAYRRAHPMSLCASLSSTIRAPAQALTGLGITFPTPQPGLPMATAPSVAACHTRAFFDSPPPQSRLAERFAAMRLAEEGGTPSASASQPSIALPEPSLIGSYDTSDPDPIASSMKPALIKDFQALFHLPTGLLSPVAPVGLGFTPRTEVMLGLASATTPMEEVDLSLAEQMDIDDFVEEETKVEGNTYSRWISYMPKSD